MAEIVSNSKLVTEQKTTKNGSKYETGRPYGSNEAASQAQPDSHGPPFKRDVNWVPGGDWTDTDSDFRATTGISRWKIEVGGTIWHYRLSFTTDQSYNYTFTDGQGQGYGNYVLITGEDHYIDYNSDDPTIKNVSGI